MTTVANIDATVLRATEDVLERQHHAVREAAWRTSVASWFDAALLSALCQDVTPTLPPGIVMAVLESLPFVDQEVAGRLRHHSQVRSVLRAALDERFPGLAPRLEENVVAELTGRLGTRGIDADEAIELARLLIVHDEEQGAAFVDALFDLWGDPRDAAHLDRLLQALSDRSVADRLSPFVVGRIGPWEVWAAAVAGNDRRVVDRARAALATSADDETAALLTLQLAKAELRLGDVGAAKEHAAAIVERDDEFAVHARLLLGDLSRQSVDALEEYARALTQLLGVSRTEHDLDKVALDVEMWMFGYADDTEDNADTEPETEPVLAVGYAVSPSTTWFVEADPLFAEAWLRVGAAEARRGRIDAARAWLDAAAELFREFGDADGARRAQSTALLVATHLRPHEHLHRLIESQKTLLDWARTAEDRQVELATLLDLADALRLTSDNVEAEALLTDAAALADELGSVEAHVRVAETLAWVAMAAERWAEAADHVARARALAADTPELRVGLDRIEAEVRLARDDLVGARQLFDAALREAEALDDATSAATALGGLARVARTERDLREAERLLRQARKVASGVDQSVVLDMLIELAEVLRLQRRDEEASAVEAEVEATAGDLGLEDTVARLTLSHGHRLLRADDHHAAAVAFQAAVERFQALGDPENELFAQTGLASALGQLGRVEEALTAADRAVALGDAARRPALLAYAADAKACVLVDAGRLDEAVHLLTEARRIDPTNANICINLAWAYFRADAYEESLRWSDAALQLDSGDVYAYRNVGHALLGLGKLDEAIKAYARAINERFGDDHFRNTLEELARLRRRRPDLPGLDEVEAWFRDAQAALDAGNG